MGITQHNYVGENDWHNTNDVNELLDQVARDKFAKYDIRDKSMVDHFDDDFDDFVLDDDNWR